jgi:hypothetical protein
VRKLGDGRAVENHAPGAGGPGDQIPGEAGPSTAALSSVSRIDTGSGPRQGQYRCRTRAMWPSGRPSRRVGGTTAMRATSSSNRSFERTRNTDSPRFDRQIIALASARTTAEARTTLYIVLHDGNGSDNRFLPQSGQEGRDSAIGRLHRSRSPEGAEPLDCSHNE